MNEMGKACSKYGGRRCAYKVFGGETWGQMIALKTKV